MTMPWNPEPRENRGGRRALLAFAPVPLAAAAAAGAVFFSANAAPAAAPAAAPRPAAPVRLVTVRVIRVPVPGPVRVRVRFRIRNRVDFRPVAACPEDEVLMPAGVFQPANGTYGGRWSRYGCGPARDDFTGR